MGVLQINLDFHEVHFICVLCVQFFPWHLLLTTELAFCFISLRLCDIRSISQRKIKLVVEKTTADVAAMPS